MRVVVRLASSSIILNTTVSVGGTVNLLLPLHLGVCLDGADRGVISRPVIIRIAECYVAQRVAT